MFVGLLVQHEFQCIKRVIKMLQMLFCVSGISMETFLPPPLILSNRLWYGDAHLIVSGLREVDPEITKL